MGHRSIVTLALTGMLVSNCASKPPETASAATVDQRKFEALYRSAKAIEGAVTAGVTLADFGTAVRNLATEISIARDRAATAEERAMVMQFGEALQTFSASVEAWQIATETRRDPVPRGLWRVGLLQLDAGARLYYSDSTGAQAARESADLEAKRLSEAATQEANRLDEAKRDADRRARDVKRRRAAILDDFKKGVAERKAEEAHSSPTPRP